jgi:hypothetical protein
MSCEDSQSHNYSSLEECQMYRTFRLFEPLASEASKCDVLYLSHPTNVCTFKLLHPLGLRAVMQFAPM